MYMCHCGKPLHYSDKYIQAEVQKMVDELGEYIPVTHMGTGKVYKVQRHYIALHGLKGSELDKMNFEEIPHAS